MLFVVGAVTGSFLGAVTWRWPREQSVLDGRSKCPHCKNTIRPWDNIPVVSFIALLGRCRDCKKSIPKRDFAIELSVALLFPTLYLLFPRVLENIAWLNLLPQNIALLLFLAISTLAIGVFIVDAEHQYIPDRFVFWTILIVIVAMLVVDVNLVVPAFASGFGAAAFLLVLHLATKGKGMGLGDVKLAVALGAVFGFPLAVVWLFSSFVFGAVVGLLLIAIKKASFGRKIAFGPFLIIAFFVVSIFGFDILDKMMGYY